MRYYEHNINVVGKMVLGIVKNDLNSGVLEDLFIYLRKTQLKVIWVTLVRRGRNTAENMNALGNW